MGLPQLQSCCWVIDLKTGNIVLGCLNAFFSLVMVIVMIVTCVEVSTVENSDIEQLELELDPEKKAALTGLYAMTIILVFMFLAKLMFDILFIYGVIAERASIIKAYFVMWLVFFLLSMFTFFINVAKYSIGTTCFELFYIGLNVYAILLCHSFYKQLNEREDV